MATAQSTAVEEVAGLDKVLTRLAVTEDNGLEVVLSRLVPVVLRQLKSPHEATRKKVLEVLSHVNKRVKGNPGLQLPLRALVDMACDMAGNPMVRSFALVYTETAFERARDEERLAAIGPLLLGVSSRPAQQRQLCLRLALTGLEGLKQPVAAQPTGLPQPVAALLADGTGPGPMVLDGDGSTPAEPAQPAGFTIPPTLLAAYPFMGTASDRAAFLAAARALLLYVPQQSGPRITNPLQAAQLQAAEAAAAAPSLPPPGMSPADVASLVDRAGALPVGDQLVRRKLGLLHFLASGWAAPLELGIPFLIAACDPSDAVARRGDELFKRLCTFDGPRPDIDLESSPSLLADLFALFLGTAGPGPTLDEGRPAEARAQPASAALRSRILALLCRSVAATAQFPATVLTIQEAVYGGGAGASSASTSARLRSQGMEFAVWVAKHCPPHQLKAMAPAVLQGLLRVLSLGERPDLPGGVAPPANDHTATMLRGFAYQAVGCLATRVPEALAGRMDLATGFFAALATEPPGLRATLAEATACLAGAFQPPLAPSVAQALDTLLLQSVDNPRDAVRLCAVQWANRVQRAAHVPGRWLCVLSVADAKAEVREEAARGLRLNPLTLEPRDLELADDPLPSLEALLSYVTQQRPQLALEPEVARPLPLSPRSFLALLRFADSCRRQQGSDGPVPSPSPPPAYLSLLELALTRDATAELLTATMSLLMDAARVAPQLLEARLAKRLPLLVPLLAHVNAGVRASAARLLGIATCALDATGAAHLLAELVAVFRTDANGQRSAPGPPPKYEQQEGALMAAGFVVAACLRASLNGLHDALAACVSALLAAATSQASGMLAAAAAEALGHIGIGGGAAQLASLLAVSGGTSPAVGASSPPSPRQPLAGSKRAAGDKGGEGSEPSVQLTEALGAPLAALYTRVAALTSERDAKVAARGIGAAGLLAWSWEQGAEAAAAAQGSDVDMTPASPVGDAVLSPAPAAREEGVALRFLQDMVLGLAANNVEELQFAAGEAAALLFGGVMLDVSAVLRQPFTGLADAFALLAPSEDDGAMTDVATAPAHPGHRSPARQAVQTALLQALLHDLPARSRPEARCCAAIWLVSLLTYVGSHPALLAALPSAQSALAGLLGERQELTQEMAGRGLSAIYRLGGAGDRQALVSALVGVLQGGPGARGTTAGPAVKLTPDTQVFEEGALGTAPGGAALTTYKELCALSTELGQPDLLYRFMDLAAHQRALASRRGAAFGLARMSKLAGDALAPHVQQLLPKLYRYQYDPNPGVQEAMAAIWRALVADPRAALDASFPAVADELLREMGGRLWRNRQAACGALADLVQGRRWRELGPVLVKAWGMTMRAMDDIKESVRKAAEALARTLRSATLRLCDASLSPPTEAREALAAVLPFMLDTGMQSPVAEVRALSLDVVANVSRTAGPEALKPLLPQLVQALLEGLSSFEDARLNYLEQHAGRLGINSEKLDNARSAAARSSPLGDTLDLAARIAASSAEEGGSLAGLLPTLTDVLARGVGLNTKMGAARFVRMVATRAASGIRPQAPALLKVLLSALRKERSLAVRKAYAGAAAQVCQYAAPKRVEKVVGEAAAWYSNEGSDADSRLAAGLLLRELLRTAPDTFAAHAAAILPLAYGARMDDDSSVAGVWKEVWEEGCSSEAGAVRLYSAEITALLVDGVGSGQWGRKKACAAAIVALTELGADVLPPACVVRLATALLAELPGRLWDGKEGLLAALRALALHYAGALGEQLTGGHGTLVQAALAALGRSKASFKLAALELLEACCRAFAPADFTAQAAAVLLPSLTRALQAPATPPQAVAGSLAAVSGDAGGVGQEEEGVKPLPLAACLSTLAAALPSFPAAKVVPPDEQAEQQQLVKDVGAALAAVTGGPLPWQARLAAVQAAQALAERTVQVSSKASSCVAHSVTAAMVQACIALLKPMAVLLEEVQLQQVRAASLTAIEALLDAQAGMTVAATTGLPVAQVADSDRTALLRGFQAVLDLDARSGGALVTAAQRLKARVEQGIARDT